jgi:hypothetical protein
VNEQKTDRELLEAAARAAGMNVLSVPWPRKPDGWFWCDVGPRGPGLNRTPSTEFWNALIDDGDAFRLLTRLPFRNLYVSEIGATVSWLRDDGSGHGFKCDEYASEHGGDLNAATRRAIVRAAAQIGAAVTGGRE